MALQDAEYYYCVSTQSTASEEAEVCLGLGDDIGFNISVTYILLRPPGLKIGT